MEELRQQLVAKNVASHISDEITGSVSRKLLGQTLDSWRVKTMVERVLAEAVTRILSPPASVDVLRAAFGRRDDIKREKTGETRSISSSSPSRHRRARDRLDPYKIVFVGVNGVGKSTSLAKVAYWLKRKGLSVYIAACDTFRSGAIEQLKVHARSLKITDETGEAPGVFESGYAKDPSGVAAAAIQKAKEIGKDVVLIDTAGRMQNNEPLMRALGKLVAKNQPDLILFVGEALVGNDAVDQLTCFNRALADYSGIYDGSKPRQIDGIVLTKFDTVDDKVGTALSMAHTTGRPIVFVGTGQKYTHLRRLNVRRVVKALFSPTT